MKSSGTGKTKKVTNKKTTKKVSTSPSSSLVLTQKRKLK